MQALLPFAVIGSEEEIEIDGQPVRARIYPWGIAEVDNPKHSDFSRLRSALLKYAVLSPYITLPCQWLTLFAVTAPTSRTSSLSRTMSCTRRTVLRSCRGLCTPTLSAFFFLILKESSS